MIAWELAGTVARSVAGVGGGAAAPSRCPGDLAALGRRAEEAVVAYTGLVPRAPLPSPQDVVARGVGGREHRADADADRAARDRARRAGGAAARRRCGRSPAARSAPRSARSRLHGPARARAVRGRAVRRRAPARAAAAAARRRRTCARARARLEAPLEDLLALGRRCTRSRTPCSSPAVPWLQDHLAGLVGELLAGAEVALDAGARAACRTLADLRALVGTRARRRSRHARRRPRAPRRCSTASRPRWRSSRGTPST